MKVRLKAFRKGTSFVTATAEGHKGFSKVGDTVEFKDEAVAHKLVTDFPDMLELVKDPEKTKVVKKAPKDKSKET